MSNPIERVTKQEVGILRGGCLDNFISKITFGLIGFGYRQIIIHIPVDYEDGGEETMPLTRMRLVFGRNKK